MSSRVSIEDFAKRLAAIPEAEFTHHNVLQFTHNNVVDSASLNPYLWFSDYHYTRNLVLKTDLFELIAICWEVGQKSPIHNHRDQNCWMAIPYGKLQVHNFVLVQKEPSTRFCELRSSGQIVIDPENPTEVDPEEPIHQVLNLSSFASKAVSLHIYSRPFDSCEVYDLKEKRYEDVPLINTTEYGKLIDTSLHCQRFTL
jgi:cysteine dioxygenase